MTEHELVSLERQANEALFRVDPDFARELGYVPPEERPVVCMYCDIKLQYKDMLAHQHANCEKAQESQKRMSQLQNMMQNGALQGQQMSSMHQQMQNQMQGYSMNALGGAGISVLQQMFGYRLLR